MKDADRLGMPLLQLYMARAAAYSSILAAFNQYLLASFLIAVATALTAVMGCDMVLVLASGSALRTIYVETVFWLHPSDINATASLTELRHRQNLTHAI